jgi:hypothetical protein
MAIKVVGGCTIPAGGCLSNGVDLTGSIRLARIVMPANGWTPAPLTFQMSPDDGIYHDIHHVVLAPPPRADRGYDMFEATAEDVAPGTVID